MKTKALLLFVLLSTILKVSSQVGINSTTPKATLDVVSQSGATIAPGIIAPRISLDYLITNSNLYNSEQKGTILYVTDVESSTVPNLQGATVEIKKNGYYYFDGLQWVLFVIPDSVDIPTEPWLVAGTKTQATSNTENIVQNAQVGVGFPSTIDPSAQFEVKSSDKGMLVPRLSTIERDAIASPTNSLLIFNTDSSCFNFYRNGKWKSLCGDIGQADIIIPNCSSASFVGTYKVGTLLQSSNYIQIPVNVVEPGNYSILVNGENPNGGFFFQKEGTFPNAGNYTIQIPGIGTPTTATDLTVDPQVRNKFTISINDQPTSSCNLEVKVDPASVSFGSLSVNHTDVLYRGESSTGKGIEISVTVINPGLFNFTTNTVNGLNYAALNQDLTIGTHTIILSANGNAPTATGFFTYDVTGTGNTGASVQASVEVKDNFAVISSIACASANINGTYKINTAVTAVNYIDIPITSSSKGTYTISITSDPDPGFRFTGSGTITSIGTSTVRVYATGTPTLAGELPFTVKVNNASCELKINVVLPPKSILLVGDSFRNIKPALLNTSNFGPTGISKVEAINLVNPNGDNLSSANLKNYINNSGVQIIIIGWSWNPDATSIGILNDFVVNKKGFVFWAEAQDDQVYLKSFLDKTYGGSATMTEDEYNIYTAKVDSNIPTDNPYINGVFGNVPNAIMRADDAASWIGIVPNTLSSNLKGLLTLPANGTTSTTGTNSARVTFIYGDGFFMYPDWGMLNYGGSSGYSDWYGTPSPIGPGSGTFNGYVGWDGVSVGNKNVNGVDVKNWIVFGNAIDYMLKYVQKYWDASYQVQ